VAAARGIGLSGSRFISSVFNNNGKKKKGYSPKGEEKECRNSNSGTEKDENPGKTNEVSPC